MTENTRFELIWETDEMCNVFDNDVVSTLSVEEVCDLLNEYDRRCNRWVSENNRLKKEIILIEKRADKVYNENEQLKQALREQLEENGNSYCIKILDKIFDLKYDEWQRKMNETHTYDYIDWEKVLKDKGDVE